MQEAQYPTDLTDAQWQILEPFFRKRSRRGSAVHRPSVAANVWECDAPWVYHQRS